MQNSDWEKVEPGWYCADGVGGICQERDRKWYFYPIYKNCNTVIGAFKTLAEAKKFAEGVMFHAP